MRALWRPHSIWGSIKLPDSRILNNIDHGKTMIQQRLPKQKWQSKPTVRVLLADRTGEFINPSDDLSVTLLIQYICGALSQQAFPGKKENTLEVAGSQGTQVSSKRGNRSSRAGSG